MTRLQVRIWDQLARAVNHNPDILLRTQDLPPIYEENSSLYLFTRNSFERAGNRIGERPLMFDMDRLEAVDIDEEIDFRMAEFLYDHLCSNCTLRKVRMRKVLVTAPYMQPVIEPIQAVVSKKRHRGRPSAGS